MPATTPPGRLHAFHHQRPPGTPGTLTFDPPVTTAARSERALAASATPIDRVATTGRVPLRRSGAPRPASAHRPRTATLTLVAGLVVREGMAGFAWKHGLRSGELQLLLRLRLQGGPAPLLSAALRPPAGAPGAAEALQRLEAEGLLARRRRLLRRDPRLVLTEHGRRVADRAVAEMQARLDEALRPFGVTAGRYVRNVVAGLCAPAGG